MASDDKNRALSVCSFIFALVSLLHLVRGVMGFPFIIDRIYVPIWASFIAFVLAGALAVWCYRLGRR